jgi:hypothetical protein
VWNLIGIVALIAMSAVTCIGGVTLLCTSGRSYNLGIGVVKLFGIVTLIAMSALTCIGGVTLLCASGSSHNLGIGVVKLSGIVTLIAITALADISGVSLACAGRSSYHGCVLMAIRAHFLAHSCLSANRAFLVNPDRTALFLSHYSLPRVLELVGIIPNVGMTAFANVGSVTVTLTGRLGHGSGIVM